MVGQFHLAGYKWTTPRLLSTQNFLLNNHMWVDFISIEHLHQLKFKLYSPSGPDFILKWVATEHMAPERPEVAKVVCT